MISKEVRYGQDEHTYKPGIVPRYIHDVPTSEGNSSKLTAAASYGRSHSSSLGTF